MKRTPFLHKLHNIMISIKNAEVANDMKISRFVMTFTADSLLYASSVSPLLSLPFISFFPAVEVTLHRITFSDNRR